MNRSEVPTVGRLQRHEFRHFKVREPLCLRAESGSLWVTVDGSPDDIELDAGESRRFDGSVEVVVGTLGGPAVYRATPLPHPPSWARRLWVWLLPLPAGFRP